MPNPIDPKTGAGRPALKVEDKRHWARKPSEEESQDAGGDDEAAASLRPTIVDEYRLRAEAAERKLREYIEAFKKAQADHEEFRERLRRDVDRKVEVNFGSLVTELLETVDALDLALAHLDGASEDEPLAKGVALARDGFLGALERHGVSRLVLDGEVFDPNDAEAVQIVDTESPEADGTVAATLRAGYRLGDRVIRPARVAVARHRRKT
ncbi:MAG: nucleotide exchange factor GrpE [Acidobacteriia bacterium]|nr:nucleotide exchange factor GrpE [Terriglobia bacterium]